MNKSESASGEELSDAKRISTPVGLESMGLEDLRMHALELGATKKSEKLSIVECNT